MENEKCKFQNPPMGARSVVRGEQGGIKKVIMFIEPYAILLSINNPDPMP